MTLRVIPWRDIAEYNRRAERTIVAAAVFDVDSDTVYVMDAPARHHQIVHAMAEAGKPQVQTHEQGFLTSDGFFLRRAPAMAVAQRANQLLRPTNRNQLYSEDVW